MDLLTQIKNQLMKMSGAEKDAWLLSQIKLLPESKQEGVLLSLFGVKKIIDMPTSEEIDEFCEKVENGKAYISAFCNEIAEEIIRKREKYPVKCYCTFGDSVQEIMAAVGWKAAFPVYQRIYSHLFFERRWYPEIVEDLPFK